MNAPSTTPPRARLLRNARAIGFDALDDGSPLDLLIDAQGLVAASGPRLPHDPACDEHDLRGMYLSPGWCDLHTHIYFGATDASVRLRDVGAATGVATLVDAGSAGEANFVGFREYVAQPATERVRAFLNLGSIGLVACNRVSELSSMASIDVGRTLDCIHANRDIICGIKVRSSGVIVGDLGIAPLKIGKRLARLCKLPLMVHVGEMPPLPEEIFELLTPGDIITHCFHGKPGANILEDDELFAYAERLAAQGVVLDIGHGAASFSYQVGRCGIERGLMPTTISTDVHSRNIDGPVWDLSLVMSKFLELGMSLGAVVRAGSVNALKAIGEPHAQLLAPGTRASFTVFEEAPAQLRMPDSQGTPLNLSRRLLPRFTLIETALIPAASRFPQADQAHPHGTPAHRCGDGAC